MIIVKFIHVLMIKGFKQIRRLMGGKNEQGQNMRDQRTCVPFISEYTDCNEENQCSGCTKCLCSGLGMWECLPVHRCDNFEPDNVDEELLDAAIDKLDLEKKELDDRTHLQLYANFRPDGKIYKLNKTKAIIHNKSKSPKTVIEKKNKSYNSTNTLKKKQTYKAPSIAIGEKDNLNSLKNAIETNDISYRTTTNVIKEVTSTQSMFIIANKENSNELIDSDEKKNKSTESMGATEEKIESNITMTTVKTNKTYNEFNSSTEKKDLSKEVITIATKSGASYKAIDTIGKNDKSNRHIEVRQQKLRQRIMDGRQQPVVPSPNFEKNDSDELLGMINGYKPEQRLKELIHARQKRSSTIKNTENKHHKRSTDKAVKNRHTRNSNNNNTVKFYSTVDELNEDTLKHSNISGTLHARRVELNVLPDISRRSNNIDNSNKSLHIDFNQPKELNHITDNKIDLVDHENKIDLSHEKLNVILGNHTQQTKDKTLSKLIVNELKPGSEIIGDSHAPVTSNITFTSENDTLTAMAFIAGNLLNKLWSMEKDASGFSLETEDMKYEKISDLLDLFKEPLNLRQEAFLKNALEQLSNAIDKDRDIKNVTICQTIEEATRLIDTYNNTDEDENPSVKDNVQVPCEKGKDKTRREKNNRFATIRAISKINNVLDLMKKFENIKKNISILKNESEFSFMQGNNSSKPASQKIIADNFLTKDETSSLNIFGNILDKITKLLLPKSSDKKFANIIKTKNALTSHQNIKNNFMKMHNIDLSNMTVTAKDKLILDYITHIKNNPDCILNKKHENFDTKSLPSIEGNILLNLSEFFKMKSFADLINLLQPGKETTPKNLFTKQISQSTKTTLPIESTTVSSATEKNKKEEEKEKFASTKEKLKAHLKSIIEDLIELQNSKGIVPKSNIRIADALPCIYKIMNAGKDILIKNNEQDTSPDRIVDIFNALKKDMKVAHTRRSYDVMKERPKSAVVLERIVKSFVEKSKIQTRRFAKMNVSKPVDELKNIMNKIKKASSIYKNQALYDEVPAAEKLVLLKALAEDVRHYIIALEAIKRSYQNVNKLPVDQYIDLATFVDNSAANISLNTKVIKKVEKVDIKNRAFDEMYGGNHIMKDTLPKKSFGVHSRSQDDDDNMKISRNQIINHLIGNRMKIYIKLKEAKQFDLTNDLNYNIAKRVLFYLDNGNYNLAQELFKMLVMQKQDKLGVSPSNDQSKGFAPPIPNTLHVTSGQDIMPRLLPVIQLDEPTTPSNQMKWMSQDHLTKQLLNIKNMGL